MRRRRAAADECFDPTLGCGKLIQECCENSSICAGAAELSQRVVYPIGLQSIQADRHTFIGYFLADQVEIEILAIERPPITRIGDQLKAGG